MRRGRAEDNRITYRGRDIEEWWRVLPLGYEQGFTLERPPAGHGQVVLRLRASAAPTVTKGNLAWGELRYGKVHVTDAGGRVLPSQLTATGDIVWLSFEAASARYPVTVDPVVWTQQEVSASDGTMLNKFGNSVVLSSDGSTALVGASDETVGGNAAQGAVYVFTESAGTWHQVAELTASDGKSQDQFGCSIALSAHGASALVGAYRNSVGGNSEQGAAYVFVRPPGGWATTSAYTAELTASDGASQDDFGFSVALSGDGTTALVGAYDKNVGTNPAQGTAYIFMRPSDGWAKTSDYTAELTASDGAPSDWFGWSVAMSGDGTAALVGVPNKNVGSNTAQGVTYVFAKPPGGWATTSNYTAELTASDGAPFDWFGWSVAMSTNGITALVGAEGKAVAGNYFQGAAYVFTESGTVWSQAAKLTASNGAEHDYFGSSVALSGDANTVLVGDYRKNVNGAHNMGAGYVFTKPPGGWAATSNYNAEVTASDSAVNEEFGYSVALSGDGAKALVGADTKAMGYTLIEGVAYFMPLMNLSGVLNTPAQVIVNSTFDNEYIVTNHRDTASGDIQVQLPLPPSGVTYTSVSATQGTCNYDTTTKTATCDLGSISGNETMASATLTLKATGSPGTIITQKASLENIAKGSPNISISESATVVPKPPTVANITNVRVTAPNASNLSLALTGTGNLTVTASSNNTTLLPDTAITGASACTAAGACALTLTPATGTTGTANVTITVTDSYGQQQNGTFSVTVTPPPAPMVGSIGNVSVTAPHAGTAGFNLTGTGTLVVTATSNNATLLPNAAISGASSCTAAGPCTLALTPAAGKTGTANVTVTVSDSYGQQGTGIFTFTVAAVTTLTGNGGGGAVGLWVLLLLGSLVLARLRPRRGVRNPYILISIG